MSIDKEADNMLRHHNAICERGHECEFARSLLARLVPAEDSEEVCFCTRRHEHVWPGGRMPSPASLVPAEDEHNPPIKWSVPYGGSDPRAKGSVPAEDEIKALVDRAEEGFDLSTWHPRPAEDEGHGETTWHDGLIRHQHGDGSWCWRKDRREGDRRTAEDEGRLREAAQAVVTAYDRLGLHQQRAALDALRAALAATPEPWTDPKG